MSHSLVDHEHIRVLVWAALQPRLGGPVSWRFRRADGSTAPRRASTRTDRDIGRVLVDQIERTTDEHHGSDDDHDPYVHASPVEDGWSAIEVLKALGHYTYHAFDEETETGSNEAAMFCAALGGAVLASVVGADPQQSDVLRIMATPEWDAAPLEIDVGTVPAAGRRRTAQRRRPAPRTLTTLGRPDGPVRPRSGHGRPRSPVPWVMPAADQVWAWDPGRGPIRLTDLDPPDGWHHSAFSLTPDGTTLRYLAQSSGLDRPPPELRTLDLRTGETTAEPPFRNHVRVVPHTEGTEVRVEYTDVVDGTLVRPIVHVQHRGVWRQLRRTAEIGSEVAGVPIAFSPSGDLLAVTWRWGWNPFPLLEVVDLRDGDDSDRRWAVQPHGQAPWSPRAERLLVEQTQIDEYTSSVVAVWDRWQRTVRPIAVLPEHRDQEIDHLAWVDDRRLLSMVTAGRQVSMLSVDPDTGERHEYVTFRRPVNRGEMQRLLIAPEVVHADPDRLRG